MKYLLDTNIISEMQKSKCNQNVRAFMDKIPGMGKNPRPLGQDHAGY